MSLYRIFLTLILLILNNCSAANITSGNNSPIITNVGGDVVIGMTINEHESRLRKEIERVENDLKKASNAKTRKLVNELSELRKELEKVLREKNSLAKMVFEYRKKFSELNATGLTQHKNITDEKIKTTDIFRIEESENGQIMVVSEIENTKDEQRMMRLLNILIKDTESMNNEEKKYWYDILTVMSFEQKLKLTEILAVERSKLAILERKYTNEIKWLNAKHLKEFYDFQISDFEKKGDKKAASLIRLKVLTIGEPSVTQLREAESKTREFIKSHPDYLDAYIYLIEILNKYNEDRSYDAKITLENAKELFQNSAKFNKELAYVYLRLDEPKKAYPLLKKAVMSLKNDEKLLRIFSRYATDNGDAYLALRLLDDAYGYNKHNDLFIARYSYALDEYGDNKKSIDVLLAFIKTDKTSSVVYEALGWRYYDKKEYKLAVNYFTEASKLETQNYNAPLMSALAHIELSNNVPSAINLLNTSLQRFYRNSTDDKFDKGEIHLSLAILYLENGQIDKAIEYSSIGVKNTYGCSSDFMLKRNWHNKVLEMLNRHRLSIGCP